jgi:hypothetical protein
VTNIFISVRHVFDKRWHRELEESFKVDLDEFQKLNIVIDIRTKVQYITALVALKKCVRGRLCFGS